jgi:hypothetical protein
MPDRPRLTSMLFCNLMGSAQLSGQLDPEDLRALDVARRQEAKSLALRATMSLSRLWQQQDKPAAYRRMTQGEDCMRTCERNRVL